MDTRAAAERIGTDPKSLRRFIRTPGSTFQAVGSGGRYDFEESDIPELKRRFTTWMESQSAKPAKVTRAPYSRRRRTLSQAERDAIVWAEEGHVVLPDIRDPRVLASVRAEGARRDANLDALLRTAGLHISQQRG